MTKQPKPQPSERTTNKQHGGTTADPEQYARFLETARELGADPHDPRIRDVLKGMAAQGPKPHAEEPKRRKKAHEGE